MIENSNKRILFINPSRDDGFATDRVHMGLSLLGQILTDAGCTVKVLDYAFLKGIRDRVVMPELPEVLADFAPDLVGISVFTYLFNEVEALISEVSRISNALIVLGGPHVTLFPEDYMNDQRVSYLVRGEGENIIVSLVQKAVRTSLPVTIEGTAPVGDAIPPINLDIVHGSEYIENYQMQLSRGCPFNCSFCNVEQIAGGRNVRARDLTTCVNQIVDAKKRYPSIRTISITDDCPNYNKKRFKEFLVMLAEQNMNCSLIIDNVRADLLDEEMIQLYVKAGGHNICLGTESGSQDVFNRIHKGESLEQVKETARLIHKYKLQFGLCFVIGLPGDSLEDHALSVALAKELKPDYVFWNMCTPWPGTEVYEWFKAHGTVGDVRGFSTLIDTHVNFSLPRAWSAEFTREDRIKAWLVANMETYVFRITPPALFFSNIIRLWHLSGEYGIYPSFFRYLFGAVPFQFKSAVKKRLKRIMLSKMMVSN